MPKEGQQKEPKRLRELYLVATAAAEPVGFGPPRTEVVLVGVYNAALREAWFLVDTIPELQDIASRVMTSVIEPLKTDPWFLSNQKKRVKWAKTAARHLFLDDQKARKAELGREQKLTIEIEIMASIWGNTERLVQALENHDALARAITELSDHQQEILVLYIEESLGPAAIAKELDTTTATISKELKRILERLRVALTGTNIISRQGKTS